jgi:hypothetical protein
LILDLRFWILDWGGENHPVRETRPPLLKPGGELRVVPRGLGWVDLLKAMFTMTCYIVLQFCKIWRIFDPENFVSLLLSAVSLSHKVLGQAWDKMDQHMRSYCRETVMEAR